MAKEDYPAMKESDPNQVYKHSLTFAPVKVRYVKVIVRSEHSMPEWHGGKGKPGFLFVDELQVN